VAGVSSGDLATLIVRFHGIARRRALNLILKAANLLDGFTPLPFAKDS
jgi:hypothetical protein